MKQKQIHLKGEMKLPKALIIGLAVGVIICLLGVIIIAYLIHTEKIEIKASGYGVMITLMIASFMTATVSIANKREKALLTSVICAAVLVCALIAFNLIIFGNGFEGVAVTAAVVFAGSIAAALLSLKPKKNRVYRGSKIGNR